MILGKMILETTQYGKEDSTCKPYEEIELKTLLDEAKEKITGEIAEYEIGDIEEREKQCFQQIHLLKISLYYN